MNNLKLLIYDFNELYKILYEIKNDVDIEVDKLGDEDLKKYELNDNYLIITKKKNQ